MRPRLSTAVLTAILIIAHISSASADVVLRYKMAKGDKLSYLCTTDGTGTIKAMGRTDPVTIDATFIYTMACTKVDEAGNLTVVHEVKDLAIDAAWGTQAIPVNIAIPTVTTVIAPSGKILKTEVKRPEELAEAAAADPDANTLLDASVTQRSQFDIGQFFGQLRSPGFPLAAVHPGSRWKDALKLTTASAQPITLTYVTKLLDYARLDERDCARLQTDYEVPLDLSLVGGELFSLTGKQVGSQCVYFDYEAGQIVRYDGTADSQITMSNPQLFAMAGGREVTATMSLQSVTSVVLQKKPKP